MWTRSMVRKNHSYFVQVPDDKISFRIEGSIRSSVFKFGTRRYVINDFHTIKKDFPYVFVHFRVL